MVTLCLLVGFIVVVFMKSATMRIGSIKDTSCDNCLFVSDAKNNFGFYDIP